MRLERTFHDCWTSDSSRHPQARRRGHGEALLARAAPLRAAEWKKIPIGTQLWCVRKQLATDIPGTLKALGAMGYEAVELENAFGKSGPGGDGTSTRPTCAPRLPSPLAGAARRQAGRDHRVQPGDRQPNLIIRSLRAGGLHVDRLLKQTADAVNDVAERLKPHAMRVGYHNHTTDFNRIDGEYWWNRFADGPSKDVVLQFDTGNASEMEGVDAAGPDPAQRRPHDLDAHEAVFEKGPERLSSAPTS